MSSAVSRLVVTTRDHFAAVICRRCTKHKFALHTPFQSTSYGQAAQSLSGPQDVPPQPKGKVTVNGKVLTKAGTRVAADSDIRLSVKVSKYVSRAGHKLEAGLRAFQIDVAGFRVLDAGISTGGFTHCLLQNGAAEVIGVDVGYGKVAELVRSDPRVKVLERTNLRTLQLQDIPDQLPCQLVTLDLSFISITSVLSAVTDLLSSPGHLVALIKPQFEAARNEVEPGGVVTDPAVHVAVINRVKAAAEDHGLCFKDVCESPIRGQTSGNREFLAHFTKK